MRLITFDPFRTLGIPGVSYIKPELYREHLGEIRAANWLLFPEYWQVNALVFAHRKRVFPSISSYSTACSATPACGSRASVRLKSSTGTCCRAPEDGPATAGAASPPAPPDG